MRPENPRFTHVNFSGYPSQRFLKDIIVKKEARLFEEKVERDLELITKEIGHE